LNLILDTSNLIWKWLTLWVPSPAIELLARTAKTTWGKCSCTEKHSTSSNVRRCRWSESMFFPLNISVLQLMLSINRNSLLINW
jgi:hypothetical protein